jgi:hypothetical protein
MVINMIKATEECKDEVAEAKSSLFTYLWTVKLGDFERALIIAVISGPLFILLDWATVSDYQWSWNTVLKSAVAGGAYLIKNLITGAKGRYLTNNS